MTALTSGANDDEIRADFDRDVEQLLPRSAAADECLDDYAAIRDVLHDRGVELLLRRTSNVVGEVRRLELVLVGVNQREPRPGRPRQTKCLLKRPSGALAEVRADDDPPGLHDLNLGWAAANYCRTLERSPSNQRQTLASSIRLFASIRSPVVEPSEKAA